RAANHVRAVIGRAAEAGVRLLSGPLYFPVGYLPGRRRSPEEWMRTIESWQALAPEAARAGVDIGIEPLNRFETLFLNTAAAPAASPEARAFGGIRFLKSFTVERSRV